MGDAGGYDIRNSYHCDPLPSISQIKTSDTKLGCHHASFPGSLGAGE